MSRTVKILGIVVLIIAILAVSLWGIWTWFTRQAIPRRSGSLKVPGLSQPVDIVRDEHAVAHIYARTAEDLFFAQGFVHAQERFWQMEFQRRTAAGRLSEIFGTATLETDKYLRHFGFAQLTELSYQLLDPDTKKIVDAYTAGVNAYIQDRSPSKLGLEFGLLGLQGVDINVEPWTPVDSLIWGEMMMFGQADQLSNELRDIELLATLGEDRYMDMLPEYRTDRPVIIPSEELDYLEASRTAPVHLGHAELEYLTGLLQRMQRRELGPAQLAELGLARSAGSNSFVVGGDMTTTGMPLLANDPHMPVNMPALWYEIQMQCFEKTNDCPYNLRGFSLPGVPGLLIGYNDRIAWGLTNAYFDAEDVFIERINPANPDQYEVNGEWVDMEIRREEIKVQGQEEPEVIFVRSTRNGVIATDGMISWKPFTYEDEQLQPYALSYAWTALQPVQSIRASLLVNKAQNFDEFVEALRYFEAGQQNWLYADVDGNIGYIMPGNVPIRAGGDGSLPVPGWNDDYIWTGYIPYEQAPRAYNPEQGFIATANNPQVIAQDYPYLLSIFHDRGQRAERITEMIQADTDGISIEDMIAIQTDNKSISAEEIIGYLKGLSFSDPDMETARNSLLNWDAQMTKDSPEAALFNIFWAHLLFDMYGDDLAADLVPPGESYSSDYVSALLPQPNAGWWDDRTTPDIVETRDDILVRAFEDAYQEGIETYGADWSAWRWGDLHTVTFRNATLGRSGIGIIENIFNRGPFPVNGSESVIQKTCWSTHNPYEVNCLPALRQVVDLGDLSNSRVIHSVGQSGHPMDDSYDNFIDDWINFRYHAANWTREEAEAGRHSLLVLEPGN